LSTVKDKSGFNIEAAELLIQEDLYCSSIHCSYYGCFQYIMFTLKSHLNITYEQLKNSTSGDSHVNTIQKISQEYRNKGKSFTEAGNLSRDLNILKNTRIKADYSPDVIGDELSQSTLRLSKRLIMELKTTFR